jgi:hypothetical protein
MNYQDDEEDELEVVELLGRLNKLTEAMRRMDVLNSNHLEVINVWRTRAKESEQALEVAVHETYLAREARDIARKNGERLVDLNRTYSALNSELNVIATMAAYDRDRARDIAARLEAECAACWGPVHNQLLNALRLGESLGVDDVTG